MRCAKFLPQLDDAVPIHGEELYQLPVCGASGMSLLASRLVHTAQKIGPSLF